MMGSVDGGLVTERYSVPYGGKSAEDVINHYFPLSEKLGGGAWIVGRKTVQEYFFKKTFDFENRKPAASFKPHKGKLGSKRCAVVADSKGKIVYEADNLDGDNIIAILGETVSDEYLEHLRGMGISYVFAGKDGSDMAKAMDALGSEFGMKKVLLEGGGILNGTFLKAGLVDELSLMVYPGIDGLAGKPSIFEYPGEGGELPAKGQSLELVSVEKLEDGIVWLYYKFHRDGVCA